jgi:DNA-binding response OmpR family regulator
MSPALRIFVVDDEEDAQLILCHTLVAARLGRPAAIFSDGEDFLRFWDNEYPSGPNLLLLDLSMPCLNGFDVLLGLRERAPADRLQTIIISSSNLEEDRARALKLGAHDYLIKFPTPEVLAQVAGAALKRQQEAARALGLDSAATCCVEEPGP